MRDQSPHPSQLSSYMMFVIAILAVYQILFASRVLLNNGVSAENLTYSAMTQILIAGIWGVLFCFGAYRLIQRHPHAMSTSAWLLIGFLLSRLLQTVLLVQADYDRGRIPFQVIITLMILIVPAAIILHYRQTDTQK